MLREAVLALSLVLSICSVAAPIAAKLFGFTIPQPVLRCADEVIQSVEWVGIARNDGKTNYERGGNPANRGGGDRIFPDRNHPVGTTGKDDLHDRLLIRVTLLAAPPQGASVTVYSKLFDVDHYSDDTALDPNGAQEPEDNVKAGEPLITDIAAKLMKADFSAEATSATLMGDGTTKTVDLGFQITHMQPGNNWKLAVECDQRTINAVVLGVDGKIFKTNRTPGAADWPADKQTPLLTVWRHLYAEIDRMGDPVFNTGPGQSKFDSGAAAKTGAKTVRLMLGGTNTIVGSQENHFQGGKIELLNARDTSLGVFDVTANTTGGTPTITIVQNVPAATAKFKKLTDDDINNTSTFKVDTSAKMAPDTSLWASRLDPALVVPVFDQPEVSANNSNAVTFDVHVGDDDTEATQRTDIKRAVKDNKGSKSEPGFWVVYQLGAFQGRMDQDKDPDLSTGAGGVSSVVSQSANDTEAGTILYAEIIREISENGGPDIKISVPDYKKVASIHEIGHEFGMTDGPTHGPLMDGAVYFAADTAAKVNTLIWNGAGTQKDHAHEAAWIPPSIEPLGLPNPPSLRLRADEVI